MSHAACAVLNIIHLRLASFIGSFNGYAFLLITFVYSVEAYTSIYPIQVSIYCYHTKLQLLQFLLGYWSNFSRCFFAVLWRFCPLFADLKISKTNVFCVVTFRFSNNSHKVKHVLPPSRAKCMFLQLLFDCRIHRAREREREQKDDDSSGRMHTH